MSNLLPSVVACPRCDFEQPLPLFECVDGDRLEHQVALIVSGDFERTSCPGCGHAYRPEHNLLYVHHGRRTWIAMHPVADRKRFATLEHGLTLVVGREFAQAPPLVAERLRGVRPRLVFGQHMLSEAVRVSEAGMSAPLLECAKLLAVRRNLGALVSHGPFELCFERFDDEGRLHFGVHALPGGEKQEELTLPSDALAEAQAAQAEMQRLYPLLFEQPYISACRYLWGAAV